MISVTRRYHFPAAHVLARADMSRAENERVYGKCANPHGHGHDYRLEVTVTGPLDPRTGRVVDPEALDRVVDRVVLERLSHRLLNGDPAFRERVPTAENIARAAHAWLAPEVAAHAGARLRRVRLHETAKNTFDFGDLR